MLNLLKRKPRELNKQSLILPNGQEVGLRFRKNKSAKRLILRFDPTTLDVVVTLPSRASDKQAQRFVDQHIDWIMSQSNKAEALSIIEEGAIIPIEGLEYKICHDITKRYGIEMLESGVVFVAGPKEHLPRRLTDYLKKMARERLTAQVVKFTAQLQVRHQRITIRDTKSRWGSCAANGNLNFSWRLILAPPHVLNYVAAHEVAHLEEHNHSPAFWALVEKLDPDWKIARDWLRANGAKLHAYQ